MFKKIKKALKAIGYIIKNPWLLNVVLEDNELWKKYVIGKYNLKTGLPVVQIEDLLDQKEKLNLFAFLDGGSLITDHLLLKKLATWFKDCSYFEIGTWRGESVKNVSEVAKECYTINLSDDEMKNLGLNENYINSVGYFSKNTDNVIHLKGNSLDFDYEKLNKKFDLIFIDGEHHYDFVKKDTENIFKHLLHEESIIVWHDFGFSPEKIRYEVFAAILDGTPIDEHENLYAVSNTLCAIYCRKKLNSDFQDYPLIPKKKFKLDLQIEDIK